VYPYQLIFNLQLFRKLFPKKVGLDYPSTDRFDLAEPNGMEDEALDFLLEALERDDEPEVQENPQNVEPLDFLLEALAHDNI
jgi:hypothetical protein